MKAHLLFRDRDAHDDLPVNEQDLTQDLGLDQIFDAMAGDDGYLREVARRTILTSLTDVEEIRFRQDVLRDCLAHPAFVRELYALAVEAVHAEKKVYHFILDRYPMAILRRSVEVMRLLMGMLRRLRELGSVNAPHLSSEGFRTFAAMLATELDDDFFGAVDRHLDVLRFRKGVLVSAELGQGCKGTSYVLREQRDRGNWLQQLLEPGPPGYTLRIHERDEAGARALSELRDRGIDPVANALAQSVDHVVNFFTVLRQELGFYLCCLNLRDRLVASGRPVCLPEPVVPGVPSFVATGLVDTGLCLRTEDRVVGSNMDADARRLVVITGANQGGKSSFLRAVGVALLMMQAGVFVTAESFRACVATGVFTHYRRDEDVAMERGRFDDELARMSHLAQFLRTGSVVLFNESFSSTNEREGAHLASGVLRALAESGVRSFFVTHVYYLAHSLHLQGREDVLFLRAERLESGERTYRIVPGEPLSTSFGQDLYARIFEPAA